MVTAAWSTRAVFLSLWLVFTNQLRAAVALRLTVFPVGRPILPLDALASYRFSTAAFSRLTRTRDDRVVVCGLEYGSSGVGAVCVVDAERAEDLGDGEIRAPLVAISRFYRRGPATPGGSCDVAPWLDVDDSECDAADGCEVDAHDAWLLREASDRATRSPAPSRALAALVEADVRNSVERQELFLVLIAPGIHRKSILSFLVGPQGRALFGLQ